MFLEKQSQLTSSKTNSKSINVEKKKYNFKLSGGDTTNSNKVSFSITTIGFANKIIERNKAKIISVTLLAFCLVYGMTLLSGYSIIPSAPTRLS